MTFEECQFGVSLIKGPDTPELRANCTHVAQVGKGRWRSPLHWWIFEGDLDCLETRVIEVDQGVVGALGDLTRGALIDLCARTFPAFDLDNVADRDTER